MTTVRVRKQGGAAIITIPAGIVKELGLVVGSALDVAVVDGALSGRPHDRAKRKRFTLDELLVGATPSIMRKLADHTEWAREGDPVGREI